MKDLKNPKNALELLGINIPEPPVIPYAPETESEEETSPLVMPDRLNELAQEEALEQSIPEPAPSINNTKSSPSSAPTSTPNSNIQIPKEQSILELYKKMRADQEKAIMDSRKRDNDNAMYDQIMRGTDKIANAFANRSGITNINNKHESLKSDFEKLAKEDTSRSLQDLLQEYNMKRQASQDLLNAQKAEADRKYKQDLLNLKRDELKLKGQKSGEPLDKTLTSGEKSIDREFGKKYANYLESKGDIEVNRSRLQDAINKLKTGVVDTGTFGGMKTSLLDKIGVMSEESELKSQIRGAIQGMLRPILGGQFAMIEGENVINTAFDPKRSTKENIKALEAEVQKLDNRVKSFQEQAEYFQKSGGTLKNYMPENISKPSIPPVGSIITSKGRKFRVIDEAGNLEEVK